MTKSVAAIFRNDSGAQERNTHLDFSSTLTGEMFPEERFRRMLFLERKRSERSERSFVLMLLEATTLLNARDRTAFNRVLSGLAGSTRDTDPKGWYEQDSMIGVIFTELGPRFDRKSVIDVLRSKVMAVLSSALTNDEVHNVHVRFRVFPEDWDDAGPADRVEPKVYDKLLHVHSPHPLAKFLKRSLDVTGSLLALIIGLPIFLLAAIGIKLTSPGPILFRQKRLGQYGRKFDFLKFRSMCLACDDAVHREYVKRFIVEAQPGAHIPGAEAIYKLVDDPRVTRVGRFLRRTSLDELPQFWNVLKGEMSLVGPRPPLPYELECYRVWHKTRLLAAKPGMTGLWQVWGRSRVKFDDMVRMDLKYAASWSLWLDLKILLETPRAILSGSGAH